MVRLRAEKDGRVYTQQLVNRLFEDAEDKMRAHGVSDDFVFDQIIPNNVFDNLVHMFRSPPLGSLLATSRI